MNNSFTKTKLGMRILCWILISLTSSILLFFVFFNIAQIIIKLNYESQTAIQQQTAIVCKDLQKYVDKLELVSTDIDALDDWADRMSLFSFNLMDGNTIIYSSYYNVSSLLPEELSEIIYPDIELPKLQFADKEVQIRVIGFFGGQFYLIALIACAVTSFIVFLIILLNLIRKHVSYIVKLEDEVSVLEGGNLEFPITIKGKDELAGLAYNIEQMRLSFIEKLENEDKARNANSELITAMSHDLRTPLTTQIGYLDIIALKKYKDEEQLFEYVEKTREKAYQIKSLSDKLFKYFLAFEESTDEDYQLEKEVFSANELYGQILEEQIFFIEEKGFKVEYRPLVEEVFVKTNAEYLCRIFDNIFSNIAKYASKEGQVKVTLNKNAKELILSCNNEIYTGEANVQSTEIGLKNSQKIALELGGKLQYHKTDSNFFLQLMLPIEKENKTNYNYDDM